MRKVGLRRVGRASEEGRLGEGKGVRKVGLGRVRE